MQGLNHELRRMGYGSSSINRDASRMKAPREVVRPEKVFKVSVVSNDGVENTNLKALEMICQAYRKGHITEDQARNLASRYGNTVE